MRMARAPDLVAGHGAAQHHRIAAQPQYLRHHRLCTYSHPGRVLLRPGEGYLCRSTASVRTGRARIRTRGGCSYGWEEGLFCVGAPPRCDWGGHISHPKRVLLRPGEGRFLCRSTASVRTGRARIRTRGGCSYDSGEGLFLCRSTAPVRTAWTPSLSV